MLRIENLYKTFYKNKPDEKVIFKNLNLSATKGDFIVLVGRNGVGKSTLMNLISGSIAPDSGRIFINEKNITNLPEYKRAKFISRVFQDPLKGTAPDLTIEENLTLAMLRKSKKNLSFAISEKASEIFKERLLELNLGLEDRLHTRVGVLSGGQRQALTLLMATFVKPEVLLLDEHTAALDPKSRDKIFELTYKIAKDREMITLMITHDVESILDFDAKVIELGKEKVEN